MKKCIFSSGLNIIATGQLLAGLTSSKSTQRSQTSLAMAAHYSPIAQIPDLESHHGDPDHPKNLINFSLYHCRAILKSLSQSDCNFFEEWLDFR